jgi:hypothetical protein
MYNDSDYKTAENVSANSTERHNYRIFLKRKTQSIPRNGAGKPAKAYHERKNKNFHYLTPKLL